MKSFHSRSHFQLPAPPPPAPSPPALPSSSASFWALVCSYFICGIIYSGPGKCLNAPRAELSCAAALKFSSFQVPGIYIPAGNICILYIYLYIIYPLWHSVEFNINFLHRIVAFCVFNLFVKLSLSSLFPSLSLCWLFSSSLFILCSHFPDPAELNFAL